jgi:hypothetical protein
MLIARLFLTLPLVCPNCGADMRIVAFVTEAAPARRILNHLGEPADLGPDWEALAGLATPPGDATLAPRFSRPCG